MKKIFLALFLLSSTLAFSQSVRTTITSDGTNVTVSTPVNTKVIPVCDFHWSFSDGNLKLWIEGNNEIIPGGRLGSFTVSGATTQASKLAALGVISDQCGGGGLDSLYYGTTLLTNGDTIAVGGGNTIYTASDSIADALRVVDMNRTSQQIYIGDFASTPNIYDTSRDMLGFYASGDSNEGSAGVISSKGIDYNNMYFFYKASANEIFRGTGSSSKRYSGYNGFGTNAYIEDLVSSGNSVSKYVHRVDTLQKKIINIHHIKNEDNNIGWSGFVYNNSGGAFGGSYSENGAVYGNSNLEWKLSYFTFPNIKVVMEDSTSDNVQFYKKYAFPNSLPGSNGYTMTWNTNGTFAGWSAVGATAGTGGIYGGDGTAPADVDVAVTDSINFDAGTLFINGASNRIGIGTANPDRQLHNEVSDAATNTVTYGRRQTHVTSGTAAAGFGAGSEIELENGSGTNAVAQTQETTWSDATAGSEDATYKLRLVRAGVLTDAITVNSLGAITSANSITSGSFVSAGTHLIAGTSAAHQIRWSGSSIMTAPADGQILFTNSAATDFNRLQFGGTTSSFPALKRSTTELQVRLADDSGDADLKSRNMLTTGRLNQTKGADVASANDLTLGTDGNVFHITGTTQINAITTANWSAGEIILIFDASVTVKNNTAGGAGTAVMILAGGADFSATANDVLKLVYDGTRFFEVSRSVN